MTSIEIPEGIASIERSAFGKCTKLESIELPEGIISIEDSLFESCTSLSNIKIPESVVSIGMDAFRGCSNLSNVEIPEGVTYIGTHAFYDCHSLKNIIIPESITYIEKNAFSYRLKSIRYIGTKEQWDKLNLSSDDIWFATVYYNYNQNHIHIYEPKIIKAATCLEVGDKLWICKYCGESYEETISATGHAWEAWKVGQKASVIMEGIESRTCKNCGLIDYKSTPRTTVTLTMKKGTHISLKPYVNWRVRSFSSSNTKVVTVNYSGEARAVAVGTAKITARFGGRSGVITINVPGTTGIKGLKSSVSVKRGKRYKLKPKLSFVVKADKVTYKSSNKKIATVSKSGVIKGKKKGRVTITIKSGKVTKKCKVKVK